MKLIFALISFAILSATQFSFAGINEDSLVGKKKVSLSFYDTSSIFQENWKVNITFAYADKSYSAAQTINLTDSMRGYSFPIESKVTSPFGKRGHSFHKGIDIPTPKGSEIRAAFDGKVRYSTYNNGGFGNLIIIRHANGLETYYAHLSKRKVKANQIVRAGEVIGLSGNTGRSYSPHLHFEVRYHDKPINPENVFDTQSFCLRNDSAMLGELILKNNKKHRTTPPVSEEFLAKGTVYSIKPGDTLSKIARNSGSSVAELCALNNLDQDAVLRIGQRIRVN
ncbi:MAG TPA: LysM peptidoglycan-binding domain-containing protein [Crocinitomicaceae bacterium]|nr:LysM peptidoglycan-binding domain-containing protein [Crocinitomicaceae bacterium]